MPAHRDAPPAERVALRFLVGARENRVATPGIGDYDRRLECETVPELEELMEQ